MSPGPRIASHRQRRVDGRRKPRSRILRPPTFRRMEARTRGFLGELGKASVCGKGSKPKGGGGGGGASLMKISSGPAPSSLKEPLEPLPHPLSQFPEVEGLDR